MVTGARALLVLAAAALPACFKVDKHEPGPLIVDDFDDRDNTARAPEFGDWSCYMFNPGAMITDGHTVSCGSLPGDGDDWFFVAQFTVTDPVSVPPDGIQQHGGAALRTRARGNPIDVREFRWLAFDVRVDAPNLPNAEMRVELGCQEAVFSDGGPPPDPFLASEFAAGPQWTRRMVDLERIGPPAQPTPPRAPDCLRQIDSLRFSLDAGLADGQSATGSFSIDNIELF